MNNILCIIPYFGGVSKAAPSSKYNRPHYYGMCYESLSKIGDVVTFVQNLEDYQFLKFNFDRQEINLVECEPQFLPYEAVKYAQEHYRDYEYVLFTEADQVWFIDLKQLEQLTDINYISPMRLEQHYKGYGAGRGECVVLEQYPDKMFSIINSEGLTKKHTVVNTYGGGFICTLKTFQNVKFNKNPDMPVEEISSFSILKQKYCILSKQVYVIHLSGYEYHQKLAGVKDVFCRSEI